MNEQYQEIYNYFKSNKLTDLDANSFYKSYSDPSKSKELWSYLKQKNMTDLDANAFHSSYFGVKKKEVSQSTLVKSNTSSGRLSSTTTKPTASSSSPEILTDYLGKSKKKYKFEDNQWYEENPKPQVAKSTPSKYGGTAKTYGQELKFNPNAAQGSWKPIEEESRIKALNYYYKKEGSLVSEQKVFTNYDEEKKDNLYRIEKGQWERKVPKGSFAPVNDEIATQALNKRYGQNVVFKPTVAPVTKKEDPKFMDINSNLTAKTEEDAISYLKENYGKYGFEFTQEGVFAIDQIRVRTKDGKKEEVFEFDQKDPKEAARLRTFLEQNKTKAYSDTYNYLKQNAQASTAFIADDKSVKLEEARANAGKFILSEDYSKNFMKLSEDEMKDQITNVVLKSGLTAKDIQKFYQTDAYKAYKAKKVVANQETQARIDELYDQSKYAKLSGDKAKEKEAQNKIDAYLTNDVIADNVKNYDMQLNDLKNRNKQLEAEYSDYEKQVNKFNSDKTIIDQKVKSGEISTEQYNAMVDGLNQRSDELNNLSENIQTKAQKIKLETENVSTSQKKLNYVAGKYVAVKEKEGSAIGFAVNSILNGVSGAFIEPFISLSAGGFSKYDELSPEDKKYYKDKGYNKNQVENILDNKAMLGEKNKVKQMLISNAGFEGTTQEYMKSEDRGFIATAIGGVLQSLPAMALGVVGKAASFTGLAAQAYSGIEEEMLNDPDFQTTSVGERSIIAIPYAIGMGILENAGLTNMIKGNSVTGKALQGLVTRTIANAPKGATQDFLNKLVAKEIESNLAKGVIKITQAGLAEFETGATQSLVLDQGLKQIYNVVAQRGMTADEKKDLSQGEFFDTADSFGELATQTLEDGLAEMIGGVTLGAVGTLSQRIFKGNVSIYNADDVEFLKNVAGDDNFKKLFVANLKTSMLNGSMTKGQAQDKLDSFNEIQAVFTKLPDNISKDQVKQAMDLVVEKTKLEKETTGKDPALVDAQTERINAINDELKTISQNAVQKQTTSEVSVQPGAKVGGEVAKRESQAGSQVIAEESQKVEIGGTIRGHQTISGDFLVGDVRGSLPEQNNGNVVIEGLEGDKFAVAFSRKGADGKNIFEQGTTTPRPGYISASVKIAENATPEQIQAAQQEAQRNLDLILPTVVDGVINAQAVNDVMAQQPLAPAVEITSPQVDITVETDQVATYRAEEQAELLKAIPKIESYKVNGEIDKTLMPKTVLAKYNKIYNKYDKLISPLLETIEQKKNLVSNQKETNLAPDEKIQPERTGDGRTTRTAISKNAPLEGAPTIQGATGPDPELVSVAEKYAAENDIDLKRQGEYVELDEERAKRIADAYEQMANDPQNPKVKEAYAELIKQTKAQYQALVDAGYKFWFINFNNPENIDYISSPYNAMRDLRQNKQMGVFPTEQGFGSNEDMDVSKNPLLEDTGIMWPSGGLDGEMKPVTANDLFRAVHDAFGHGLEGAGFRARGEENAWQSHSRLYTGAAIGAMTSETRGQNSWVNYGPKGEQNRTASGEDTIFADQKVGLMPEWTSQEGRAGDMEADVLTADTKDATNLQKVLDALDKIEGDLDQFGKETLGVNIPVVLAKAIVKAVKALVKAGITLEQAIKQVATENGLNDRDVKSLFNPTKVSEIDVNEVRSKARPGKRVSKGLSVKTVAGKKVVEETEDLSLEYVKENAPKVFISNANIIAKYPLVAGKQKFKTATTVEQAQEIYDVFVREVADNLNYLMNEFKPEYRDISTLWYDGANAIANDFAEQFDVSPEQAAGIIAAMSPQKDWYQNVRLAEMVLMAYKDNPALSQEMIDYQKGISKTGLYDGATSPGKKLKKAEKAYKESRTKANKEALDKSKVNMQEAIDTADALIAMLKKYIGKNLNDVPAPVQPYMVRTYHEVNTSKDYNIVAPDGSVQGVAKKKDGSNAKVAWGSYVEIGKAVAIKNDGSQANITRSLGEMHKIRNFYNNIIDPMSEDGDVTMDTHAIAAALLLPLSGGSVQVTQNFGGKGTAGSDAFGIKGLYYAYADAYALAAKEAGLLPRQVQSITWEAVRGLYTDTFKRDNEEVAKINNIWKDYQDGKITINEARDQAKESAGGIKDPTWAGPVQTEPGDGAGAKGVEGRGDGNERDTVGGTDGGGVLTANTKDKTNLKKALDVLNKADQDLGKFGRETLGINIPVATMRAIIKLAKVLVKTGITLQEAIIKAAEQLNVSKEDALNAVKFMSETIKSPVKKVLVNEAAALKDQLRLEARAAREAKADLNTKRKQIAAFIRSLETKGSITARQAAALVKRVSSLNLDNQTMVDRFEQYAEKVFKRAEYQDLLTSAFRVRRLIRKAIKSENQAEVVGMAKLFSKIDPSLVDDIDNYIALAESVLNAVRPSKEAVKDPALRQAVNIEAIAEYANEQIANQEENRKRELMAEYKYLVDSGVLTDDLSAKEMQEIINLIENPTAQFDPEADQKKLNFLQNRLASMEAVFRYILNNNINPFTGEEVVIEAKDADLIKRLLKMDLNEMSVRDAAKVVEAMDNYLMNNITSGLEAAVRSYEGAQNAKQLVAQGKKARPLRSYFNKTIGRFFGEQMISLPLLFEKMFPGIKNSAKIMQMMGLVDVINGSNKAIRQHNDLMTEYSKQDFYKEKGFMEAKNVYERGMLSFLKRNLIGTKNEIRDEFKRRAEIIKQSIDALRENGTDKEIEMADLYQEAYDKLGVAELDLDVIEANAGKMNKDAVAWMINEWGKYYGELADVSLSVYNSMLGSDTNYTPDRYKSLSAEDQGLDEALLNSGSGFMMSMDYTDKNKTGVLMEATRPKVLPNGRYISLDFDVNNFNSLKGALVDINTAAAIRQVDGFVKSKAFNKLVPEAKDRKILTKRINTYIQRAKGKRTVTTDTIKDVERLANFITGLGVGKALAGLDQPIKQTVPVMINTVINSGGTMTFVNADMNEAINRSGMPIANRGLESQTAVESIDRLLEKTGGLGAEAIKKLEDLNQFWLKTLLAKPDVWVARSSFITYYLKDMKSKGENVKDIDWSKHEWDKDSAQYAQLMVDRQQNISDDKLAGDFLSSDDPTKRIARKVIMPFATFIMNQKARMHNDFLALRSKDTSVEDRKSAIKSLTGLGAELFAYQLIAYGVKTLVYDNIANLLVGDDDEEEKKDKSLLGLKMTSKQYSATKFPIKSIVGDILSPLPIFDDLITMGFDKVMENFPQVSDEDIKKAVEEKNTILRLQGKDEMDDNAKTKFIDQLKSDSIYSVAFKNDGQSGRAYGMMGIAYDTYKELIDLSAMAYTGEFEDEYQGRVTNKYLPEEDRKILQNISVPLMILYSTGIAPKDLGTVARKVTNIVKKKGVTENQHEKEKEVKKQINRDLNEWEFELVKTRKKANGVVDEINYVESKGGLDDKQGKEYVKLMEAFPTPSDDMLRDIQKGMTADQIIKKNKE